MLETLFCNFKHSLWGHVPHKILFCRFDIYLIQMNKQTEKTAKQAKLYIINIYVFFKEILDV